MSHAPRKAHAAGRTDGPGQPLCSHHRCKTQVPSGTLQPAPKPTQTPPSLRRSIHTYDVNLAWFRYVAEVISSVSVRLLQAQSDDRLLALVRDGHERAFEALVKRYHKPLLAYGRRLLPAAVAEDAVQQGLLQAWLALQRGTEVRDLAPWLYRIVYHAAIRMQRAASDDLAPVAPVLTAEAPHLDLERRIAARDALAGAAALPALQREALLQTVLDGRTHHQVAETLGLSDGAVRGLLYRARATLRAAATALTPSPLVAWAMHAGGGRAASGEQLSEVASTLSEVGTRAAGASIAAALGKGGAIAISAGVFAAGTAAIHSKLWPQHARAAGHARVTTASLRDAAVNNVDATLRSASTLRTTTTVAIETTRLVAAGSAGTRTGSRAGTRTSRGGEIGTASHQAGPNGNPGRSAWPTTRGFGGAANPTSASGANATASPHPPGKSNAGSGGSGNATTTAAPSSSDNTDSGESTSLLPSGSTTAATATTTSSGSENSDDTKDTSTPSPGSATTATPAAATSGTDN